MSFRKKCFSLDIIYRQTFQTLLLNEKIHYRFSKELENFIILSFSELFTDVLHMHFCEYFYNE